MRLALEIQRIGVRSFEKHPPQYQPIADGADPYVALAIYVEAWAEKGAQITGSYGNPGTIGIRECPASVLEHGILRIRIIDLSEMDTQEITPVETDTFDRSA